VIFWNSTDGSVRQYLCGSQPASLGTIGCCRLQSGHRNHSPSNRPASERPAARPAAQRKCEKDGPRQGTTRPARELRLRVVAESFEIPQSLDTF
jgi:hypothetical protein